MLGKGTIFNDGTGAVGKVRSLKLNVGQDVVETTAADTTTARTYVGTWSGATVSMSVLYDADDASHVRAEVDSADASANAYVLTFTDSGSDTAAFSGIMTSFSPGMEFEGVWEADIDIQVSGDITWTHNA